MREAAVHRVPVRVARCGDQWSTGDGVVLSVLSPCGALLSDGKNDVNENSIVAMLRYGGFRMLFMGDAGFETETRMLGAPLNLQADVLKVGHHGSAYASGAAFLAAVRPRLALISVGRHNLFGHPAPSTLASLDKAGSNAYRTDRCGAIVLSVTARVRVDTMMHCDSAQP
jgi:competence protein ComEC